MFTQALFIESFEIYVYAVFAIFYEKRTHDVSIAIKVIYKFYQFTSQSMELLLLFR